MHLGIAILMGKNIEEAAPTTSASLFTFLEPLSFSVWIALALSYLAVGATLSILARFSPYEWFDVNQIDERDTSMDNHKNQFTLLNSLWFAIGSLMHQVCMHTCLLEAVFRLAPHRAHRSVPGAHFVKFRCSVRCCVFKTSVPGAVLGAEQFKTRCSVRCLMLPK